MTKCVHCYVSGVVQGVFYRAGTRDKAQQLGVVGWVKNLFDGRVELVACGPDDAVDQLVAWLAQGPTAARVDGVAVEVIDEQQFTEFSIDT